MDHNPAHSTEDENTMEFGLNNVLMAHGYGQYGDILRFDTGSLFWSITRLFETYHRIMEACIGKPGHPLSSQTAFLCGDIENFIIRYRIIFNDMAYILRQLYPANEPNMPSPRGKAHNINKEMSIKDLLKFVNKYPHQRPELTSLLLGNEAQICARSKERDDIVHYKKRVVVFYPTNAPLEMAVISLKTHEPEEHEPTPGGGQRVKTFPVVDFVNNQTRFLVNFMNEDMVKMIMAHASANHLIITDEFLKNKSTIGCVGMATYKMINSPLVRA